MNYLRGEYMNRLMIGTYNNKYEEEVGNCCVKDLNRLLSNLLFTAAVCGDFCDLRKFLLCLTNLLCEFYDHWRLSSRIWLLRNCCVCNKLNM